MGQQVRGQGAGELSKIKGSNCVDRTSLLKP